MGELIHLNAGAIAYDDLARRLFLAQEDATAEQWLLGEPQRRAIVDASSKHAPHSIPPKTLEAARAASETTAIRALVDWYDNYGCEDERRHVILSGPTGVGKSTAAAWTALYRFDVANYNPLWWITGVELARLAQRRDEDPLAELLDRGDGASYLIVDDLGAEQNTQARASLVDELVDRIYSGTTGVWSLLITTNLKPKQFEARYGARVVDRLAETSTWITVRGESMRRRKAA